MEGEPFRIGRCGQPSVLKDSPDKAHAGKKREGCCGETTI